MAPGLPVHCCWVMGAVALAAEIVGRSIRSASACFTSANYLLTFALPDAYFHVATAYNIMCPRHHVPEGVQAGKLNYLGFLDAA